MRLELSIVVPIHNIFGRAMNLEKWLQVAIRENVRVILVHDKSNDLTQSVLEDILRRSHSDLISLHQVDFQSPGLTRNHGLKMVSTPWFAFADADDFVIIPNLLKLLQETSASGSTMGVGGFCAQNIKTNTSTLVSVQNLSQENLALHLALRMGLWRCLFATKNAKGIEFENQRMGEDYLYLNKVIDKQERIYLGSSEVYTYSYGGKYNLTSNQSLMIDMLKVLDRIHDLSPETRIAKQLQVYSLQKLALSLIKNLPVKSIIYYLPTLLVYIFSKPSSLLRLIAENYSKKSELK